MCRKPDKMDTHHVKTIISEFLTYQGWRYRYVNGTWWRWDSEHRHWNWMDATGKMGDALVAIVRSKFPLDTKIHTQVQRQYIQVKLIRELRPRLAHAVLPGDPSSQ